MVWRRVLRTLSTEQCTCHVKSCHITCPFINHWEPKRKKCISNLLTIKFTSDMQICIFSAAYDNLLLKVQAVLMWNHPDGSELSRGSVQSHDDRVAAVSRTVFPQFCVPISIFSFSRYPQCYISKKPKNIMNIVWPQILFISTSFLKKKNKKIMLCQLGIADSFTYYNTHEPYLQNSSKSELFQVTELISHIIKSTDR